LKVYKYLPFSDGSKYILSDGTMKFSRHSDFNDPFDCKATYDINESMQYVREGANKLPYLSRWIKAFNSRRVLNVNS
jgi:hypothetical protein